MSVRHILFVDDEADILEIASLTLETLAGWRVSTASSGAEALVVAAREQPDAIVLDVMMPEMDGPSTLLALREQPETREIPVVFLTAKAQAADRRRLGELGQAVLAKPFDPATFAAHLSEALGWSG